MHESLRHDSVDKEALSLLSPGARHDNIVRLEGVVLDADRRIKRLVLERADEGPLDQHIQRLLSPPDGRCVQRSGTVRVVSRHVCAGIFVHGVLDLLM